MVFNTTAKGIDFAGRGEDLIPRHNLQVGVINGQTQHKIEPRRHAMGARQFMPVASQAV